MKIKRRVMYKFNKMRNSDGTWRFVLDGISLIVDGFKLEGNKHLLLNPEKAIAFFDLNGNLYGVANQYKIYSTVEEFFEMMKKQAQFFTAVKSTVKKPLGDTDSQQYGSVA